MENISFTNPFVGREDELRELRALLLQSWEGKGSAVFIAGHQGLGKTALLNEMQSQCRRIPELKDAVFVRGECHPESGPLAAYGPFADILSDYSKRRINRKIEIPRLLRVVARETYSEWLQAVPLVGPWIVAGAKTAVVAGQHILSAQEGEHAELAKVRSSEYLNTITEIASAHYPLVLIIENAHWIDDSSASLLLRTIAKAPEHGMMVLVTYRPNYIAERHPLRRVISETRSSSPQLAQVFTLSGWNEREIHSYVCSRFGSSLDHGLVAWLDELTEGTPMFVSQYLSLLEQSEAIRRTGNDFILDGAIKRSSDGFELIGKLSEINPPASIEEVLKQRIGLLIKEDRTMLQVGSVQGPHFMSSLIVKLLKDEEMDILSRLGEIEQQHRIVYLYTNEPWLGESPEVYSFEHILMRRQFYELLPEPVRIRLHRRIGDFLEQFLTKTDVPSKLALEVARHHEYGGKPLSAARQYYLSAECSFYSGAFKETVELCQRALRSVRNLPEGVDDHDRLRAEVIQLLLTASWIGWQGKPGLQGDLSLADMGEEGEAAAFRTGDQALLAQAKYLRAKILLATRSLVESIEVIREALDMARKAGDPLLEFAILPDLGMQINGLGMQPKDGEQAPGLKLQYQAYDLYKDKLTRRTDLHNAALERHFYLLQSYIGVGEFDWGNFDKAVERLNESITGLKELKMLYDLPDKLNYLGQVYMAMGLFEDAEALLTESIQLLKDEEASPWRGNNLALLGKLYLEWSRVEDAVEPLRKGWEETQKTWFVALVPLVRNYYAELLMNTDYKDYDLAEADRLFGATIEECKTSHFHRSTVAALSLRGRLALMQEHVDAALGYSTEAVGYLEKHGTLPALRTEEVLFNHYCVLKANGQSSEAFVYLDQANKVLQKKGASIKDEEHRRSFMERVPVSRAILSTINDS